MSYNSLPLFPLHTVLFPRMPLRLHIFEERYKQMIEWCLGEEKPFGVVLIRQGSEVGPPATPYEVGTLARMVAIQALPEGKMYILTEGTDRFRILDRATGAEPYMVGVTEPLRDEASDPGETGPLVTEVADLFHTYFHTLTDHAGVEMPDYELPDDPEEFSFVISAVVQLDAARRQAMLEMTDTVLRLNQQRDILRHEIVRIQNLAKVNVKRAERVTAAETRPYFSRN